MPRANIFIRKDDLEKWQTIKNKSEFIHNVLNPIALKEGPKVIKHPTDIEQITETLLRARGSATSLDAPGLKLCKIHSTPLDSRGKCLQKGCKYA